jgi:hypothetical protein
MANHSGLTMSAYRKFSDTLQSAAQTPATPKPPKAPKVDPSGHEAKTLGGLGTLGGAAPEIRNFAPPPPDSENCAATPPKPPKPAKAGDAEERATIIEYGAGVPRRWAKGYAALSTMPAPTGFVSPRWQRIIDAAGVFLDRWAAEAIRCGWSDLDVFGCNPDRPDARFDAMGLVLLLDRCGVVGIDERGADLVTATGDCQRYRRRSLPADTVSLWELTP